MEGYPGSWSNLGGNGTASGAFEEESVQRDQSVSKMAEEVLMGQAKALAHQSGQSLENARQVVSDTEADRKLRDLATGEHRHEKARHWQASVFWDRAEDRMMHQIGSEALLHFAAERHSTRG